jgi:hypothetical protein
MRSPASTAAPSVLFLFLTLPGSYILYNAGRSAPWFARGAGAKRSVSLPIKGQRDMASEAENEDGKASEASSAEALGAGDEAFDLGGRVLFKDCSEVERLKRIHDARKILDQVFKRWDHLQAGEWTSPGEYEREADG